MLYQHWAWVVTRSSPHAVYDAQLATFAESGGLFSQEAAPGFIELHSLQSRMAWRLRPRGRRALRREKGSGGRGRGVTGGPLWSAGRGGVGGAPFVTHLDERPSARDLRGA